MSFYRTPSALVILSVLLFAGCQPPPQSACVPNVSDDWGEPVNGLRVSITPVTNANPAALACAFDMCFQNVGAVDTVLALGTTLEMGRVYYPHAIRLALFDEQGNARRLQFSFNAASMRPDTADTFAVPLPAGSIYTVRINLADYYCPDSGEYFLELPEGTYRAFAQFEGKTAQIETSDPNAAPPINFWTGRVQSNVIKFLVRRSIAGLD